eukprot:6183846-Pleurochrysis_carterae.AAC.1
MQHTNANEDEKGWRSATLARTKAFCASAMSSAARLHTSRAETPVLRRLQLLGCIRRAAALSLASSADSAGGSELALSEEEEALLRLENREASCRLRSLHPTHAP